MHNNNMDITFNWKTYVQKYDDLKGMNMNQAVYHYKKHGIFEGRNSHIVPFDFCWKEYTKINDDLKHLNELEAKLHYFTYGEKENRKYKQEINVDLLCEKKYEQCLHPYCCFYIDLRHLHEVNKINDHFNNYGKQEGRKLILFENRQYPFSKEATFGINLYGQLNYSHGLSDACKSIYKALHNSVPELFSTYEVEAHDHVKNNICEVINEKTTDFNVNFFSFNWNDDYSLISNRYGSDIFKNHYNTTLWLSETEDMLDLVHNLSSKFDIVFTISNFCAKSFKKSVYHSTEVVAIDSAIFAEKYDSKNKYNTLALLGINIPNVQNLFIVTIIFDYLSEITRKNPQSSISAFADSIAKNNNCFLIVKTVNSEIRKNDSDELNKYIKKMQCRDKIIVVNKKYSAKEINMLYSVTDVYISLHRSEGFGYNIFKALQLGIPTICTNYSGNTDFSNRYNSFLVPYTYKFIPPSPGYCIFSENKHKWAEPNVIKATEFLSYIYRNYEKVKKSIEQEISYLERKYNPVRTGNQIIAALSKFNNNKPIASVLIGLHIFNTDIAAEYIQKINDISNHFKVTLLMFVVNINDNAQTNLMSKLNSNVTWHLNIIDNYGADSQSVMRMYKHIIDSNENYDLAIFLHTKSNQKWRKLLSDNITNSLNLMTIFNYLNLNNNLGAVSSEHTISPLFGNMETVKECAGKLGKQCNFYELYDDTQCSNQKYDYETYKNFNSDINSHDLDESQCFDHWINDGIKNSRFCDKDLVDRLFIYDYPLFIQGGMSVITSTFMKSLKKIGHNLIDFILDQLNSEKGKVSDTYPNSTYTHAVERLPTLLCFYENLNICSINNNGTLKFYK